MTRIVGPGLFCPTVPVAWLAAVMHDCKYEHIVFFDGIQHTVWKRVRKAAPDFNFQLSPPMRSINNALNGAFDFDGEARSQTGLALIVVGDRFEILNAGLRMKFVAH